MRARLGARAKGLEAGLARDGAFYLFSLRLIPIVPFFAVNLLMGLTPLQAWTFYWVSQLGMLAGTAVYVNAGTQLAALDSLSGIESLPTLASFAFLAAFPGSRGREWTCGGGAASMRDGRGRRGSTATFL